MATKKTNGHSKRNGTSNGNGAKKDGPYPFDAFVKNWTKAQNIPEVLRMTGLSRSSVASMVTRLRKEGVKLKKMPRIIARPIDAAALNKIIQASEPRARS